MHMFWNKYQCFGLLVGYVCLSALGFNARSVWQTLSVTPGTFLTAESITYSLFQENSFSCWCFCIPCYFFE